MAGRKPDKFERHTPESIKRVAAELAEISRRLEVSATLLETPKPLQHVEVRYETSLVEGLRFIRLWSAEVERSVSDARLAEAKSLNGQRVRKTGHVSDSKSK